VDPDGQVTFSDLPEDLRDLARQLDPEGFPAPACPASRPGPVPVRKEDGDA